MTRVTAAIWSKEQVNLHHTPPLHLHPMHGRCNYIHDFYTNISANVPADTSWVCPHTCFSHRNFKTNGAQENNAASCTGLLTPHPQHMACKVSSLNSMGFLTPMMHGMQCFLSAVYIMVCWHPQCKARYSTSVCLLLGVSTKTSCFQWTCTMTFSWQSHEVSWRQYYHHARRVWVSFFLFLFTCDIWPQLKQYFLQCWVNLKSHVCSLQGRSGREKERETNTHTHTHSLSHSLTLIFCLFC